MAIPQGIRFPFEVDKTRGSPVIADGTVPLLDSSIRMILSTVPGERPYRPTFGSWLPTIVFANMTETAAYRAAAEVKRALRDWEPRIKVQDILFDLEDPNLIALTVVWRPNGADSTYRSTVEFRT